ncbi:MAG: glycosyltransferase family 4 protein [Microthrixaceae bacterium]
MHIVYAGPVPPLRGGISHHGASLVGALQELGHEVDVLTWRDQYPRLVYRGPQTDPDATPLPGARATLRWWSPRSVYRSGRRCRGCDVLIVPYVTPVHALHQRLLMRAVRAAETVVLVHNAHPHERIPFDTRLARLVFRGADRIVCHTESVARDVIQIAGQLNVAIAPIPPNLSPAAVELPPWPPIRLLFFGFVRPYKGLDVAIEAVAKLRSDGADISLTVAGEFWDPVEVHRQHAIDLGVGDRIDLRPGYVTDAEAEQLFREHHLVLLPYLEATQSAVAPVAFAAGRPVIATPVGGLIEQVHDGVNGVLADATDADSFADAIRAAIPRLDTLAAGARTSVASWSDLARATVDATADGDD